MVFKVVEENEKVKPIAEAKQEALKTFLNDQTTPILSKMLELLRKNPKISVMETIVEQAKENPLDTEANIDKMSSMTRSEIQYFQKKLMQKKIPRA